jgi:hypothetical protein
MNKISNSKKFMPRKAITKVDVEVFASVGKNVISLEELMTITDEAREKAQQLGIKVIPFVRGQKNQINPRDNSNEKGGEQLLGVLSKNDQRLKEIIELVVSLLREKSHPVSENLVNQIVKKVMEKL